MAAPLRYTFVCSFRNLSSVFRCTTTRNGSNITHVKGLASPVSRLYRHETSIVQKLVNYEENHGNKSNGSGSSRSRFTPIAPAILAWSLFGNASKVPKEEEEKAEIELKEKPEDNSEELNRLTHMLKRAKLAEQKGEYMQAEELYHQALGILNIYQHHKEWKEDKILKARVWIFDAMAQLALIRRRFQEAEKCYKDVTKGLLEAGYDKNDNAIIEVSLKLAMIYAMTQRPSEAEAGYKYCIETQEQKLLAMNSEKDENSVALLGLCIDAYSRFFLVQKKYKSALETLEKALNVAIKVFGDCHVQVAILHNDIATVASYENDFSLAKDHANKAISIGQKVDARELAAFFCNLGILNLQCKEYKEAKTNCNKSLRLSKTNKDVETAKQAEKCLEAIKNAEKKK